MKLDLAEFYKTFQDENSSIEYLSYIRWGKHPVCPRCNAKHAYRFKIRNLYKCKLCKKQFTARTGTIFEESRLPLYKWLLAVYLVTTLKKGASSVQLSKYLKITQKTAWLMLKRIKHTINN